MKKRLAVILALTMLLTLIAVPAWAEEAAPTVILDGNTLSFEVPPMIDNGRILVPLRAIFEAMGAKVDWDSASQTATAVKGDIEVVLKIGSLAPTVNGTVKTLDVPGKIVNGRTLAPLRFVGEAFGTVTWDDSLKQAVIKSKADTAPAPAPVPEPAPAQPAAPASAGDIVKASIAAFAAVETQMDFAGQVKGTPYGDLDCKINGSGAIKADKSAASKYYADLGVLDNGDRDVTACMFSEVISGPEADGLKLAASGVLTEEGNNYVVALTGVDCPQSILGILNKACSTVPIDFMLKIDCKIKFDKTTNKIVSVDNIVLTGKAKTAIGLYDTNIGGNVTYKFK
jgi:hypothetical protein